MGLYIQNRKGVRMNAVVRTTRLERAATGTQIQCSTKLSYVRIYKEINKVCIHYTIGIEPSC